MSRPAVCVCRSSGQLESSVVSSHWDARGKAGLGLTRKRPRTEHLHTTETVLETSASIHGDYAQHHRRPFPPHPLLRLFHSRTIRRRLERDTRPKPQMAAARAVPQWPDHVHGCCTGAVDAVLHLAIVSNSGMRAPGGGHSDVAW